MTATPTPYNPYNPYTPSYNYSVPVYRPNMSTWDLVSTYYTDKLYLYRTFESSHMTSTYSNYVSDNAFDNNTATCWIDGSGKIVGGYVGAEWLTADGYTDAYGAYGISIRIGVQSNSNVFTANSRPKDITVNVNGYDFNFKLEDVMSAQTLYFDSWAITANEFGSFDVKITVNSAYGYATTTAICDVALLLAPLN